MSQRDAVPPRVQVVVAFHQPLTTSEETLEALWNGPYIDLLNAMKTSGTKVAVHFSGHMLDFLARRREELLQRIKRLAKEQSVEVLGGLFYGPLPALLPELDVRGQLEMMSEFWQSLLGWTPQGFFLPELAWSAELPRLLQDSGLNYGFASAAQLAGPAHVGLGMIERGDQRLAAFVLDPNLSAALPQRPVAEWMDALCDRAQSQGEGVVSVWVRAEDLVGPHAKADPAWLQGFFAALGAGDRVSTALPSETYQAVRPAVPMKLLDRCAPEIGVRLSGAHSDWADLPRAYPEVDTLYRRMLRTSLKLKEAIATMQDEELEDSWSDVLATAQRLVFSAQAHDSYWTGSRPGCRDAALREATSSRLVRAENMLDALVQGNEDWIALEELDLDGDLADEALVCTRHLTAWVYPAQGARVRALEPRGHGRNVVDLGARLEGAGAESYELRTHVLPEGATLEQLQQGSATLLPPKTRWEVSDSRIDEEGDCAYHYGARVRLDGLSVEKTMLVPIDGAALDIGYRIFGSGRALIATEVPLRLTGALTATANGEPLADRQHVAGLTSLRLENAEGQAIELSCEPALDAWVMALEGGLLVVPLLEGKSGAEAKLSLAFSAPEPEEQVVDAAEDGTEEVAPEEAGEEALGEDEEYVEEEVDEEDALGEGEDEGERN